jgi:hypothetical protein
LLLSSNQRVGSSNLSGAFFDGHQAANLLSLSAPSEPLAATSGIAARCCTVRRFFGHFPRAKMLWLEPPQTGLPEWLFANFSLFFVLREVANHFTLLH